ncbi:FAD binding domain-containing protein [Humitalea sp. 24SJ18S-53]|uniref:FAD binding domain-containing protein n=1 Tax=Humitalea sp. 24SJ18S-53 TaxID=3422307 RepID=UPI003D670677
MRPPDLSYRRPDSLADALRVLREDDVASPIAGGQSLVVMLSLRVAATQSLVDVSRLAELTLVEPMGDAVRIGAATRHAMIEDGRIPDPSRGMLARVASGIAYRAIRNLGTIGGSMALADPAADWPVCLMALGATVVIATPGGERHVAVADFIHGAYATALAPGEILRAIDVPRLPDCARWGFSKLARKQGAFADSLCAVVQAHMDAPPVVVLGATAGGARLLPSVAAAVRGGESQATLRDIILHAVAEADDTTDVYRLRCHAATVFRAIEQMKQS